MRAWDNLFKKLTFAFGILLLVLFIASGGLLIFFQTQNGKTFLASYLSMALQKEKGFSLQVGRIEGSLPYEIILHDVVIESQSDRVEADLIDAKLSLLPLLKKEISVLQLQGEGSRWTRHKEGAPQVDFPYTFAGSRLRLANVTRPNGAVVDAIGSFKLGNKSIARLKITQGSANATLYASLKNNELQLKASVTSSLTDLKPWIDRNNLKNQDFGKEEAQNLHSERGTIDSSNYFGIEVDAAGSVEASVSLKGPLHGGKIKGRVNLSSEITNSKIAQFIGKWKFLSSLEITDEELRCFNAQLKGTDFLAQGSFGLVQKELRSLSVRFGISGLDKLGFAPIQGPLSGQIFLQGDQAQVSCIARQLAWDGYEAKQLKATAQLAKTPNGWKGPLQTTGHFFEIPWELRSECEYNGTSLALSPISLEAPGLVSTGAMQLWPQFSGNLDISVANLHDLVSPLYGACEIKALWNEELSLTAQFRELYYGTLHVRQAQFAYQQAVANLTIQGSDWKELFVEQVEINATRQEGSWPFSMTTTGDWKGPFVLSGSGNLKDQELLVQSFSGTMNAKNVRLQEPVAIQKNTFSAIDLSIGDASLHLDPSNLHLSQFPLELLPVHLAIVGTIDCDATLQEDAGSFHAQIQDVEISGGTKPLVRGGALIDARLKNEKLELSCHVTARGKPLAAFDGEIPLKLQISPFSIEVLPYRPMNMDLSLNGKIEDLFDYIDIGAQHIEGHCIAKLTVSNTPFRPHLEGSIILENGLYENYYTGARVEEIQAHCIGKGTSLTVDVTAADVLKIEGQIKALWEERFPFELHGRFNQLYFANLEWVKAAADGDVEISGNLDSMHIHSKAILSHAELSPPEKLPKKLPELQISYIHPPKPLTEVRAFPKMTYPVFLDLQLTAADEIFASGEGLQSEWKGDLHVGGTLADPEAKGSLELIKGEFSIFDRSFALSDGALIFSGKPHELPLIDLGARMGLSSVTILARLMGPINEPHLSFQSIPPLPVGSILSYVLFGEDLSEINLIQAAKLIGALSKLSGEQNPSGPLGIDKLRIAATPLDSEGGETTPLQVGKYVTRGLLVSVNEGSEGNLSNMSVEIDLINGWSFIAESDQTEEQGKFTIKWNLSY